MIQPSLLAVVVAALLGVLLLFKGNKKVIAMKENHNDIIAMIKARNALDKKIEEELKKLGKFSKMRLEKKLKKNCLI